MPLCCAGEWDGAGAVLKSRLRAEQRTNPDRQLQSARDVVDFLKETLSVRVPSSYKKEKAYIRRKFWNIEAVDRSNPHTCNTIPGSRQLHSIFAFSAADPTKLMVRELSCFCASCMCEDWENCESQSHVSPWELVKLRPNNTRLVCETMDEYENDEDWEFGGEGGSIGDMLNIGDNFAVPAEEDNDEGVEFYILQCQRSRFVVKEAFECVWGGSFEVGNCVVAGTYYQRWGRTDKTYVYLNESRVAHVNADAVIASKFLMRPASYRVKGQESLYKISEDTLALIKSAVQVVNDETC